MANVYLDYLKNSDCYKNLLDNAVPTIEEIKTNIESLKLALVDSSGDGIDEFKKYIDDELLVKLDTYIVTTKKNVDIMEDNARRGDAVLEKYQEKAANKAPLFDDGRCNYYDGSNNSAFAQSLLAPKEVRAQLDENGQNVRDEQGNVIWINLYQAKRGVIKVISANKSETTGLIEVHTIEEIITYECKKTAQPQHPTIGEICIPGYFKTAIEKPDKTWEFDFNEAVG